MTLGNDNGTDGQTDRVRRNMRPPPREEGHIITLTSKSIYASVLIYKVHCSQVSEFVTDKLFTASIYIISHQTSHFLTLICNFSG